MYRHRTRILALLLAMLSLLLVCTPALATEKKKDAFQTGEYMQTVKSVNVRSGPGTGYDKIGTIKKDTLVLRMDTIGEWSVISLDGSRVAYVHSSYLKNAPDVDVSKLNVGFLEMEASSGKSRSLKELMNNAKLSPLMTGNQTLDQKVAAIFDKVADENATTYEKFRAFYGWLVNNTEDLGTGYQLIFLKEHPYRSDRDAFNVQFAEQQLETMEGGKGTCILYAATLLVAARHLGLEAYECDGEYVNSSGKHSPHTWMFIMLDGQPYIFDAQLEFNNTKGKADYSRFGVHGEKWDKRYVMYGTLKQSMAGFNQFTR